MNNAEDAKNEYYRQIIERFNIPNDPQDDIPQEDDTDYDIKKDEIDIEDFTIESPEPSDLSVINILIQYYKHYHNIPTKITMLDGLDETDPSSTNKCMEFVYGEIFRYDKAPEEDRDILYDPDDDIDTNAYKELYCLLLDDNPTFISPYTLPLIYYLSLQNWQEINWKIINLI